MFHATDDTRPVRPTRRKPNVHGAFALLVLAAMATAVLLPTQATDSVAVASATDARSAHRTAPEGPPAEDHRSVNAAAREAEVTEDKAQQRQARERPETAPQGRPGQAPTAEIDTVEGAQAALSIVNSKDDADRPTGERRKGEATREEGEAAEKKEAAKKEAAEKEVAPPPFPVGPSRLFARHDAMHLFTPSADPVHVGFHEAAYPVALGMIPLGRALANDNGGKYQLPPFTPTDQKYMVLSSRGRAHHPTSAVDIVMRPGEPVRSVVTGMVVEVKRYALYGRYPDGMIRIRSAEDNGKIVSMLHMTGLKVHVGQQVLAGETIVADTATSFPFLSQIDYYVGGEPRPHVHIEVKRG